MLMQVLKVLCQTTQKYPYGWDYLMYSLKNKKTLTVRSLLFNLSANNPVLLKKNISSKKMENSFWCQPPVFQYVLISGCRWRVSWKGNTWRNFELQLQVILFRAVFKSELKSETLMTEINDTSCYHILIGCKCPLLSKDYRSQI